jgi:hypothetical protein
MLDESSGPAVLRGAPTSRLGRLGKKYDSASERSARERPGSFRMPQLSSIVARFREQHSFARQVLQAHGVKAMQPMALKRLAILIIAGSLLGGEAFAEDAGLAATRIIVNYGVYWAGFHFGDVRLIMTVRGSDYQMKGDGQFSVLGGLIYAWRGGTTSAGKLGKGSPKPSLYTLSYSGGDKQHDLRISFADGAVTQVVILPEKRPNPHDIPVTKQQLRGVLDPMTGAFLRARPNLPSADLKVCDETIPVFDGQMRFDIVLMPKQQKPVENATPDGYSGLAAVCGVKFVPISGYRPDNPAIKYMIAHTDRIEAWLVPLPKTALYVPYRISLPTAFGSGSAELLSFRVERGRLEVAPSQR